MAVNLMRRISTSRGLISSLRENHGRRFPIGAAAAVSGGIALYYCCSPTYTAQLDAQGEQTAARIALDPNKWLEFKLHETAAVSHNTKLYRFTFDPSVNLGLDVASCIVTRAPIGEETAEGRRKFVIRPVNLACDDYQSRIESFIQSVSYFFQVYPEGKMSQHFASLKPGDVVEIKGPIEKLRYSPNMKKKIGMVAGGTGITPMLQVIKAILKNPDDYTQVSLLYANVSPDDILLKQELDRLAASYPNFKVFYTVDNPAPNWRGGSGIISKDMALKGLPHPADGTLILVCGPPGLMNHLSGDKAKDYSQGELTGLLKELGYTEEMVYKF